MAKVKKKNNFDVFSTGGDGAGQIMLLIMHVQEDAGDW